MGYLDAPYLGLHNEPYPEVRPAPNRGWVKGLLDSVTPDTDTWRGIVGLLSNQSLRQKPPDVPVGTALKAVADATPIGPLIDTAVQSDELRTAAQSGDSYGTGKSIGDLAKTVAMAFVPGGKGAKPPIRAYHASPHSFDRFDISKIGTGEGSTVFGHGLYAAESPAVSGRGGAYDQLFTARNLGKYDLNQQEGMILKMMGEGKSEMEILREMARNGADFEQATAALERIKANKANIYDVNIHADPAKMINWDKPITQQHPVVRKALGTYSSAEPVGAPIQRGLRNELFGGDLIGVPKASPAEISQELAVRGVPGIKYLDRGSRGGGAQGSSNYVVFDPKIIEILKKYGLVPATVAAGVTGATAVPGLLGGDQTY